MKDNKIKLDKVRGLAMLGILGVLITTLSDFFLLGRPVAGAVFFRLSTESMADIAPWRITLGTFLGVVSLPFEVLGLAPLYHRLKPSGKVLPWTIVILNAHALLMGVAFHMSYAFMGSGWQLYYSRGFDPVIKADLLDRYDGYWKLLLLIVALEILVATILNIVVIIKNKSLYPRWMVAINPLTCILLVVPVMYLLPAPVGGYIAPAVLNIATLLFIMITLVLYEKDRVKIV